MKKQFFQLFTFLSLILVPFLLNAQNTFYVSLTGSNVAPYSNLLTGANDIQTAVDAASDGDSILVNDGTYVLTTEIVITKGVVIKGLNNNTATFIDGNNVTRCFNLNHANAVIENLSITKGLNISNLDNGSGGAVFINNGGTINNCIITNSQAKEGGGVAIQNSGLVYNTVISNCKADSNSTVGSGGAIRMLDGGIVRGCLIHTNTSVGKGGAVSIINTGTIQSSTITNNMATNDAAVSASNNTLMENTIVYLNIGLDLKLNGSGYTFNNNCTPNSNLLPGSGNISDNPIFGSPGNLNPFLLNPNSTLIDAGLNSAWMTGAKDLDGNIRIFNSTVDIGAYEYIVSAPSAPTLVSPTNNSLDVKVAPFFVWNPPTNTDSYTLQIATDTLFNNIIQTNNGIISPTYQASGLSNSTKYFWRVSGQNVGGSSGYSNIWSFTTKKAVTPILSWPVGGGLIYSTTQKLSWYLNEYAENIKYDLVYSTKLDLTDSTKFIDITETSYEVSNLLSGTKYYWQVKSKTSLGVTLAYSAIDSFETEANSTSPIIPVPSWPIGNALIYSNSPTLYWYLNGAYAGLTFDVEIRVGALTGTPTNTGLAVGNLGLSGLLPGTVYNWQVRSTDGSTTSDWSVQESFETIGSVSTTVIPVPNWPIGGATVYSTEPTLYWHLNDYGPGLTYELEYSVGALSGTPNITGIAKTNYSLNGLLNNTTYNWQVRSTNGVDVSDWSAQESFVTAGGTGLPGVPVPSWPIGGNTVYNNNPTLSWYLNSNSTGLEYELQYSNSPDAVGGVLQTGVIILPWTTDQKVDLSSLTPGATYYWQVRSRVASNTSLVSSFSPIEVFVIVAGSSPVVPIAGSPIQNVTIKNENAVMTWYIPTQSESQLNYELEYSENADFMDSKKVVDLTKANYGSQDLSANKDYYWRVRSKTESGVYSEYSSPGKFKTTTSITDVKNDEEISSDFSLEQNYPNPFNPSTLIEFTIPEQGNYSIIVYDILGKEIKTLVNKNFSQGKFNIIFNAKDLVSGLYIYRLKGNGKYISKKMLLLK